MFSEALAESYALLSKRKIALYSGYFILLVCLVAILAPWIAPYPFDEQFLDQVLAPPSSLHWLGTDSLGRDMVSRMLYGARVSMSVAMITAIISAIIGLIVGAMAGWMGGWFDSLTMRLVDVLDSIPSITGVRRTLT